MSSTPTSLAPVFPTEAQQVQSERIAFTIDQIIGSGAMPAIGAPWSGKRQIVKALMERFGDVGEYEAEELIAVAERSLVVPGDEKGTERNLMVARLKSMAAVIRARIEKPEVVRRYKIESQTNADGQTALVRIPVEEKEFVRVNDKLVRSLVEIENLIAELLQFAKDDASSEETARLFERIDANSESGTRVISVIQKHTRKPISQMGENGRRIIEAALVEMKQKRQKQITDARNE